MSHTWEHYHHAGRHHEKAATISTRQQNTISPKRSKKLRTTPTWLTDTVNKPIITLPGQRNCTPSATTTRLHRLPGRQSIRRAQPERPLVHWRRVTRAGNGQRNFRHARKIQLLTPLVWGAPWWAAIRSAPGNVVT